MNCGAPFTAILNDLCVHGGQITYNIINYGDARITRVFNQFFFFLFNFSYTITLKSCTMYTEYGKNKILRNSKRQNGFLLFFFLSIMFWIISTITYQPNLSKF